MHRRVALSLTLVLTFVVSSFADTSDSKIFLTSGRGLDYKFQGKKDEHRFGVEVEENRQFHHTITDADGVRLGCYGYELYGQKYSTNYIADGKGYRLAPKTSDIISVYAKDTLEERRASFIGSFGETELRAGNIRYLFPEGCDAPKLFLDPVKRAESRKKFIESLQNEAFLNQQKARDAENERKLRNNEKNAANLANAALQQTTPKPAVQTTTAPQTTPNSANVNDTQRGSADLSPPIELFGRTNADEDKLLNGKDGKDIGIDGLKAGEISGNKNIDDNFLSDEPSRDADQGRCGGCDSDKMKIILPQSDVDSCSANRMAKIAIPIAAEKLSAVPMRELMDLSSAKSTMSMLKNLQNLCEKYDL